MCPKCHYRHAVKWMIIHVVTDNKATQMENADPKAAARNSPWATQSHAARPTPRGPLHCVRPCTRPCRTETLVTFHS